jgi:hypothetical protein
VFVNPRACRLGLIPYACGWKVQAEWEVRGGGWRLAVTEVHLLKADEVCPPHGFNNKTVPLCVLVIPDRY